MFPQDVPNAYFGPTQHVNVVLLFLAFPANIYPQQIFTCLKSAIETLEKCVKYVKVNNKDTRITSVTSFWCLYC